MGGADGADRADGAEGAGGADGADGAGGANSSSFDTDARGSSGGSSELAYFEFTDVSADWAFQHPDFCELYDLEADPHQLKNLCPSASTSLKNALHAQLVKAFGCSGTSCP